MNWFKKDKFQNVKKVNGLIKKLSDFSLIEYCIPTRSELAYLSAHPEIPKRSHESPEFRMHLIKVLEQHNLVELEDIKEDEETPEEVKERRRLAKKTQ